MLLKYFLLVALTLSLGACAFKKDDPEAKRVQNATDFLETLERQAFDGKLNEENVRIEFVEDDPGYYEMIVSWPKSVYGMKLSLDGQPYLLIKDNNTFRTQLTHNTLTKIHLIALNSIGGEVAVYYVEKISPADLVIGEDLHLNKDMSIDVNRVFFHNSSRIFTHGHNLNLATNKLYTNLEIKPDTVKMQAFDAHIQTYQPKDIAKDKAELAGPKISIRAKKAYGQLRIAMIGVNGKDGANGMDAIPVGGLNGAPGKDAVMIRGKMICSSDSTACPSEIICKTPPTNGEPGKKGPQGEKGEDAWDGGSTGVLSVFIDDYSEFRLEVLQRRGLPGKKGLGGKGAPGGIGGLAGQDRFRACKGKVSNGLNGEHGDKGDDGKDGQPGLINEILTNTTRALIYEVH